MKNTSFRGGGPLNVGVNLVTFDDETEYFGSRFCFWLHLAYGYNMSKQKDFWKVFSTELADDDFKRFYHMIGSPFSCSYSVNRFSRYLLLKAHNDPLKIWTATHTFSLLMLTQLTMAVNGLLLRQCVSKAIFKLTAYTSDFKFLLKQIIKYYILIF